jgi:DNA-binding response OmpR family regulator
VEAERRSRVLIVEDDPDQYDALAFALDTAGYRVEHARDGSEALAVLQRFQPELVVTDLVMPGMSGDDLVRTIRSREADHPRILVISGMDGLASRCEAIGVDAWLGKPFDLDALLRTVEAQVRRAVSERQTPTTNSPGR